jgi:hypothetical protein
MNEARQTHPFAEQEQAARTALEAARVERDEARKRAKDFERPWSANTDARLYAERSLTNATASTPLTSIIEWQATVAAALFLDGRFRIEFEQLLQAQVRAGNDFKAARSAHERVLQQISIWQNDEADRQHASVERQLDSELKATRARRRAELMQAATT